MRLIHKIKNLDVVDMLLSRLRGNLFLKISTAFIIIFIFFLLIIYVSFSVKMISSLKENLINKGETLASVLAINSRLGVLSGDKNMLKKLAIGVLHQMDVVEISIFDTDVALVNMAKKGKEQTVVRLASIVDIKRRIENGDLPPFVYEDKNRVDIWSPIFLSREFKNEEEMMFGMIPKQKKLVGWAEVVLDKSNLIKKQNHYLIFFFSIFFLCISCAYYFVRKASLKIIGPIDELYESVISFSAIKDMREIPAEGMRDEAGKLVSAFNNLVRRLRQREEEKERLERQLLNSHRLEAIGSLTSGIAHDFNNMLSSIMGGVDVIIKHLEEDGDELTMKVLNIIRTSCINGRDMIARLLTYIKGKETEKSPLKLNEQIILFKKVMRRVLKENIEIKLDISGNDPYIVGNVSGLYQVLMNMVINAQDAMPTGGTLKIYTEEVEISEVEAKKYGPWVNPGKYAVISIEDNGIGMDENTKKQIFEPFFTTKGIDKGTGLGLYNSYSIVKEHGGFIDVISSLNEGTTFRIHLPISEVKEVVIGKEEKDKESLKDLPRGSGTIIVADDDMYVREILKELLSEFGYDVILANNGEDLVRKFKENKDKATLLLVDIMMPYKHGKAAEYEIRRIRPDVKIIFMSGYPDYMLEEEGFSISELDYLEKPIRSIDLIKKIQQVMNS